MTGAVDENTLQKNKFKKSGLLNNGFYGQDIVKAFSFAQKKAYQGGVTGTPGPPLATPLRSRENGVKSRWHDHFFWGGGWKEWPNTTLGRGCSNVG